MSILEIIINPRPESYSSCFVVHSVHRAALTSSRQLRYEQAKHVDGWLVDFAKMLSLSSYGWLTVTAYSDSSDDKNTHSWLPRHI